MACNFTATMNNTNNNTKSENIIITNKSSDEHENDIVMPGFRFHPTEEELVEFYLRRKVEEKHFNVQLITFLDLYRYDPWELPALAIVGEKEWYFYVPRDRKYRNGDRPNRVTTTGYWKATGADKMIRSDNLKRSIGLKKTLVFYSGKAPKGVRSTWIMNEYRLPHHETERQQKAEISLCRVYKRNGVGNRPSIQRSIPIKASLLASTFQNHNQPMYLQAMQGRAFHPANNARAMQQPPCEKITENSPISSNITTDLAFSHQTSCTIHPSVRVANSSISSSSVEDDRFLIFPQQPSNMAIDELHKLVNNSYSSVNNRSLLSEFNIHQPHQLELNMVRAGSVQNALSEWDWTTI